MPAEASCARASVVFSPWSIANMVERSAESNATSLDKQLRTRYKIQVLHIYQRVRVLAHSWLNCNLQCSPAVHLIQRLLVVFKLENVCHHTLHLHLSAIEVCNRSWEAVCLRERPDDLGM
jgi:hypothetical protein